ncbi:TadE family protein [Aureliella helgolandensis]|uniref:TadE-like protein n=1 Tax=Aureliella helgolandensis TaxID=2527968 RepID=A0A518G5S6_9BACT|nr:TadE/TadG family type IV pilus assembly protein [Aureliella helgolandensis]QDV23942.1 TadE-like protein [Aureliella helgolandensis]
MRLQRRNPRKSQRRGAAIVEMALILPVFVVLTFGSIEVCQRLYTKNSAVIAAYEACRVATRPNSDTEIVRQQCTTLLEQQSVAGASIQIRNITKGRDNLDEIETGDEIRVRLTIPWSDNTVSRYVVGDQGTFRVQAFMLRE